MKARHFLLIALAAPLGACMSMGDTSYPQTGTFNPMPMASGPDENTVAVARELRENDSEIDRRRDNGELTRSERRSLRRQQGQIELLASAYAADGEMTDSERRFLETRSGILQDQAAVAALFDPPEEPRNKPKKRK